jgi:hypothetical protein
MYGYDLYYCPDINNLTVQGLYLTPEYVFPNLYWQLCTGHDYCANDTEYATWYEQATMHFLYTNNYFDPNNYTVPIHSYIGQLYFNLRPDNAVLVI